jgi:thymidylate synthase
MQCYKNLIREILHRGEAKPERTDHGMLYLFDAKIEFDLEDQFPIVTIRKIDYVQAFGELAGFIQGVTTKSAFSALGCKYWNSTVGPDLANPDSLGPIYGYQWRNWGVDQLINLVHELKTNPNSRRLILSFWNHEDLPKMAIPPCITQVQFDVDPRGYLHCIVTQRSADVMLGLPYDFIVFATFVKLLAEECGYEEGRLVFNLGNAHIYENHIQKAIDLLDVEPFYPPQVRLEAGTRIQDFLPSSIIVSNYLSGPIVNFELNL